LLNPTQITSVPLLNVQRQTTAIRPSLDAAISRVLDHGMFINGPEVRQFEESLARYCGVQHAIACASGSDAILLPLMALRVGAGDRVLTVPFTFFATGGSIARLGANPVFVDIDPATFNMDPVALARHLESLSAADLRSIKAILPVHLFGQCAPMDPINEVAARYGIPVIEDAAQAIGAEYKGRRSGSMGWCGAFSFFPSKNLGGLGDGGLITTNDAGLAAKLRILREHGSEARYYHRVVGMNSRLDTLQAATLLAKFAHLEAWTGSRRAHAATYMTELRGAKLPQESPDCFHVYNQFTIRADDRDELKGRLDAAGVASAIYYPVPLHLQDCFAGLGYKPGDMPHSEAAAKSVLSIPVEASLTDAEVAFVVDRVNAAVAG
jgi:dTDP-4-amino-4,6-dideoxygalactose transaminase